jgi:hypothetical protein
VTPVRWLAALGAVLILAQPSAAQSASPTAASQLDGVVLASDGRPVADADVGLLGLGSARTDSLGRFGFQGVPAGTFLVRVQRLGYTPIMQAVGYDGEHAQHLTLRFGSSAVMLAPVFVVDSTLSLRMTDGFERRRRTGQGSYLTERDVAERHIKSAEHMLRQLAGVEVDTAGIARMDRGIISFLGDNCYRGAQVIIDGVVMGSGYSLRNLSVAGIRGIEVYRGVATTPPELRSARMACGTIAVWTK